MNDLEIHDEYVSPTCIHGILLGATCQQCHPRKDPNYNDVIRVELKVNGKLFAVYEKLCNTEQDFAEFQNSVIRNWRYLPLEQLSRFKPT